MLSEHCSPCLSVVPEGAYGACVCMLALAEQEGDQWELPQSQLAHALVQLLLTVDRTFCAGAPSSSLSAPALPAVVLLIHKLCCCSPQHSDLGGLGCASGGPATLAPCPHSVAPQFAIGLLS